MPKITVHGGPSIWEGRPDVKETERLHANVAEPVERPVRGGETEPVAKPAVNDLKAAWVEYAVWSGWDRDEAEAATKQLLVDAFKGS